MGLIFRKRITTGSNSWLNLSRHGVSASRRLGHLTINSRGRNSLRIAKGLSYRGWFK